LQRRGVSSCVHLLTSALSERLPLIGYRGRFGAPRPDALSVLALPPDPMPSRSGLRPLKAWRYVGVFGPELMLCAASVRIGSARQAFWAVWDRTGERLYERTTLGRGPVTLGLGCLRVEDRRVQINLALEEVDGVESVCPSGSSYAWTRKQGGIRAFGTVSIEGRTLALDALAVIDDTAGYYERHTRWQWSAGIGAARDGRPTAWRSGSQPRPCASDVRTASSCEAATASHSGCSRASFRVGLSSRSATA
jgi:hypothetical protein